MVKDIKWLGVTPLLSNAYNSAISTTHNLKPYDLVYGKDTELSNGIWPIDPNTVKIHPAAKNTHEQIAKNRTELVHFYAKVKQEIDKLKENRNVKLNKNRKEHPFQIDDIVFAKNATRKALEPLYLYSPFKVIEVKPTTNVVCRLIDGWTTTYNSNYIRKYHRLDTEFQNLPDSVKDILDKSQTDYTSEDIALLIQKDPLTINYVNIENDLSFISETFPQSNDFDDL